MPDSLKIILLADWELKQLESVTTWLFLLTVHCSVLLDG